MKECEQTKCAFHKSRGEKAAMLCPKCLECGCSSNFLEEENCVNCHNCKSDEGYIRDGIPEVMQIEVEQTIER